MFNNRNWRLACLGGIAFALVAPVARAAADDSTTIAVAAPVPAIAPTLTAPTPNLATTTSLLGLCVFAMKGDYAHVSENGIEASGHGWWENVNCDATLADVAITLQQYYADGTWRDRGSMGFDRVVSGGGSGRRATARAICDSTALTSWRTVIDVDVVGVIDLPDVLTTSQRNIPCRDL